MGAVKRDVVFKSELQLASQTSGDGLQSRPEQSVMHNQKIDLFLGRGSENTSRHINRRANFGCATGIFDLQAVESVRPVFNFPNAQIFVRVFDNFRKGRHLAEATPSKTERRMTRNA